MAYDRYNSQNAALLLIDHQVGTMGWMHSGPTDVMQRNTIALARAAQVTGMPVVLTSSQEDNAQGPLFPELESLLPSAFASRVKRTGVVDCFDDPAYAEAVKATGRRRLIMAGLLTEVCVVYPALNATNEGYEVQVVADASGSGTKAGDDIALDRMRQSGVGVASTIQILSEMVNDWAVSPGPEILEILGGLYAAMESQPATVA